MRVSLPRFAIEEVIYWRIRPDPRSIFGRQSCTTAVKASRRNLERQLLCYGAECFRCVGCLPKSTHLGAASEVASSDPGVDGTCRSEAVGYRNPRGHVLTEPQTRAIDLARELGHNREDVGSGEGFPSLETPDCKGQGNLSEWRGAQPRPNKPSSPSLR